MVFETGQPLRVDDLHMIDELNHWNPRLQSDSTGAQPRLGNDGRSDGVWWRSESLIQGWCHFLFAGSNIAGDLASFYFVDAPIPPDRSMIVGSLAGSYGNKIGSGRIRDDSASVNSVIVSVEFLPFPRNGMTLQMDQSDVQLNNNNPFTWADGDRISFNFTYLADERVLA